MSYLLTDEPGGRTFPNMTSLVRYVVWRDGADRISALAKDILTGKARAAARLLLEQGLVTITEAEGLLRVVPVEGTELDRETNPEPPEDVVAWV